MTADTSVGIDRKVEPNDSRAIALSVFVAVEAVAGVFYLAIGRRMWFYLDDWDFLVDRRATNLGDLFRSHNGHWVTIPLLLYRTLWFTFGLRSYLPYQLLIVGAHLAAAALLRVVMLRAGVRPWTATIVAGAFVLFGRGNSNILTAFQITMVGSLVFGLVHLLLASRDGPFSRRDAIGAVSGLFALMCSGVGVPLVFAVGIACLIRRGWRIAALHTIPLGAIYLVWWEAIGHKKTAVSSNIPDVARFATKTAASSFDAFGDLPGIGAALALVLAIGFVLAWTARRNPALGSSERRARLSAPTGLLAAGLVFLIVTAIGRAANTDVVQGRYEHLLIAMMLPALAVAIDAISARQRALHIPLLLLVLVGVPGNVRAAYDYTQTSAIRKRMPEYRRMIMTLPRLPLAANAPPTLTPEQVTGFRITMSWLLDGAKSGRIPAPLTLDPQEVAVDSLRLSLEQRRTSSTPSACLPIGHGHGVVVRLGKGQEIVVRRGPSFVRVLPVGSAASDTVPFALGFEGASLAALRPVTFRLVAEPPHTATVCAAPGRMTPT